MFNSETLDCLGIIRKNVNELLPESEQELSLKKELAGHIVRTALNEGVTI